MIEMKKIPTPIEVLKIWEPIWIHEVQFPQIMEHVSMSIDMTLTNDGIGFQRMGRTSKAEKKHVGGFWRGSNCEISFMPLSICDVPTW